MMREFQLLNARRGKKKYKMRTVPFDEKQLKKWIKQGKRFYCFGAGKKLNALCQTVDGFSGGIIAIGDNNKKLWGTYFEIDNKKIAIQNSIEIIPDNNTDYKVLLTTSFYEDVAEQLYNSGNWPAKKIYFYPSANELHFHRFSWLYKKLKVQDKIIFRSGNATYVPGWDYTDNAKALFDYMISNNMNDKYKMIWLVHDPKEYPEINKIKNVKAVSYEWAETGNLFQKITYFTNLLTAKYLFFTDAMFWTRYCSEKQVRVNLWHGNGFKAKKNKRGVELNPFFEYTTVSGPVYIDLHEKYLGCDRNKIFDTGLAKEDLLFKPLEEKLDSILHIKKADKYVFWLPTFRKTIPELGSLYEYEIESYTGLPILLTVSQVESLNQFLADRNMVLIIKLHPVQENSAIKKLDLSNICVISHIEISKTGYQINSLLAESAALISDFSSVAVDYMLCDRPMAFVLEDEEQYKESRGFVFDPIEDYLPGREIYTFEEMKDFLNDVYNGVDTSKEKRHKLMQLMHTHQDGNNCRRILDMLGLEY